MIQSILMALTIATTALTNFDFGENGNANDWAIVNDGVMGGLSKSEVSTDKEFVIFSGEVSLDNNGGFASYCSPYGKYNLSKYEGIEIRYALKGQPCGLTFASQYSFYSPYLKYLLPETKGKWQTHYIDLNDLEEYRLGTPTDGKVSKSDLEDIIRLRFLIANKKAGAFELKVEYINFK